MFDETVVFEKAVREATRLENETPYMEKGRFMASAHNSPRNDPDFIKKHGEPNEPWSGRYVWWFDSAAERIAFMTEINESLPGKQLHFRLEEGNFVKKQTVAVATLRFKGNDYVVRRDYGYGYPLSTVIFDWEENNCSCDHRRATYIHDFYPGVVPEDDPVYSSCGPEFIEVVDFSFELLD